jgi:anti-anti-sigma regulatory factor
MSLPSLHIQPAPTPEPGKQLFLLQGVVDVDAIPALEPLYAVPARTEVELDLAGVQRVNSMGLAQLLKLFEHWQAAHIRIRISHANRMTAMLFKMTGLDRFLAEEAPSRAALAVNAGPVREPRSIRPAPRVSPAAPLPPPVHAMPGPAAFGGGAARPLEWQVAMQSSQQMNGWYFLNTHLQRRLSLMARLAFADNLLGGREAASLLPELVYARPFDAIQLIARQGYRPLAGPSNQSDEVTVLARAGDARTQLAEFSGARAVAATRDSFVYLLGRYLLDDAGVPSDAMDYRFPGHEIKAVQMLLKGEADLLFMDTENYQHLSGMTRRMLKELDRSEARFAFHLWCLSPRRAELAWPLRDFLLSMGADEQGRQILGELGVAGWVEPAAEDIAMLERIFTLYGG